MNRIDHSVEIVVVRDNIEKRVNLPFICDDQLWFQIFKTATTNRTVSIPALDITIDHPLVEQEPK
jgi:hypothetical protein